MAGAAFRLDIDDRALKRAIAGIIERGDDVGPLMRDWGEALTLQHEDRFRLQESPDGAPWEPLDPAYEARKRDERPAAGILVFDEFLRRLHYNAGRDYLEFGSGRIYAATHQFGDKGRGIPARPFLGVSDDDRDELLEIARDYFRQALEDGKV